MSEENSSFSEIAEIIRNKQRFVVMSHVRPDGDALGCTLAFGLCLQQLGKDVTLWNEEGCLEKFQWLPGSELLNKPAQTPQRFDVAVVLDTAVKDRVGSCLAAIEHADVWINMDHHVSNPRFGDLNYVDAGAPATGEIIYEFFRKCELPITYAMADNLYVAISTDTGSFQYSNTTARTYEIAADLIRAGVNVGDLSRRLYESHPRRRLELLKSLLNAVCFSSHDRVASFALTQATTRALDLKPDDNEGVIDYIRAVEGVIVAAFFEELEEGKVRVSLRSKDARADVCKVALQFGGGGHKMAAGIRMRGTLSEVQQKILSAINDTLPTN